ncbi:MAG: hypothetical protein IRZ11_06985 [Clostridia bacterium]|nr:hypothetical protein [Clostridia bacterium]
MARVRVLSAGRRLAAAVRAATGLAILAAVLAWAAAHDPVGAAYAHAVAELVAGARARGAAVEMTLRLLDRASEPRAEVLVDGRPVADLAVSPLRLAVAPGAQVAIDARAVPGELLVLAAWGASPGRPPGARLLRLGGSLVAIPWDAGP